MRRKRTARLLCTVAVLSIAIFPIHLQSASDVEQDLRDHYKAKIFVLRGFYDGSYLRYDASGQLARSAASGDWTVDGLLKVDDLHVSDHRLSIRATRLHMGWVRDAGFSPLGCPGGKTGEECEKAKMLNLEADFGPSEVTADNADALLAKVFLTPEDHFAELVPDYWKPCVLAGLSGTASKDYEGCTLSPEFVAVPGVALGSDANADPNRMRPEHDDSGSVQPPRLSRVGQGIAPPKPLYQRFPEFNEPARRAKYQGTVTLMLVVDRSGAPTNVHVLRPLGCGLDEKAVRTVEAWRFKPAEKDGEPVDVEIAVEVDFHLF